MPVVALVNLWFFSFGQELILFFQKFDYLRIVNLLGTLLIDLFLRYFFDFKHDSVESAGVNQAEAKTFSLIEKEVNVDVP